MVLHLMWLYLHSTIFKLIRVDKYFKDSFILNLHSTIFKLIHLKIFLF